MRNTSLLKYYSALDRIPGGVLARIFSPATIEPLIQKGSSPFLKELIISARLNKLIPNKTTVRDIFEMVYGYLLKNYRNEYIYKNVFANQVYLGEHSLDESSILTEFRVGECKADIVVLNGNSHVYEIKTELDSFDRLSRQIQIYEKCFEKIHIITAPDQIKRLRRVIDKHIGIHILDEKNEIKLIRQAQTRKKNIDPAVIFDSLRRPEYLAILEKEFGSAPNVPNAHLYRVCKEQFLSLSPSKAHGLMVSLLKKRKEGRLLREYCKNIPSYLSAYYASPKIGKINIERIHEVMGSNCRETLLTPS